MSSRINLNDNIEDHMEFSVGGLDYDLKYPTLNELKPLQDLMAENDTATPARQREINEEVENIMYSMIHPVGHETPIKTVLDDQTIKVRNKFSKMLTDAFSM